MTITLDRQAIIQIFKSNLKKIQIIYLFGSKVNNSDMQSSDIDVAVLTKDKLDGKIAFKIKNNLSSFFKKDIDLVDLKRSDTVTIAEVITSGICIYTNDQKFLAEFETIAMSKYAHLNEERKGIIEDIVKRGNVYDR